MCSASVTDTIPCRGWPCCTGRIVGSAEQSDRFLWDLRRLVADRIATEYVGGLRDLCRPYGLELWLENYGHWGFPSEFLRYGSQSDRIGGEFWMDCHARLHRVSRSVFLRQHLWETIRFRGGVYWGPAILQHTISA